MAIKHRHLHGAETLQEVRHENRIAVTLSECAHDICRADVATTALSDIDSCDPTREIAERDRSQQIAPDHYDGEREHQNVSRNVTAVSMAGCLHKLFLDNHIDIIATSVGVIPLIRAACPRRIRPSTSLVFVSFQSEGQEFRRNSSQFGISLLLPTVELSILV